MDLIRGKEARPWKVLLYGVPGVGKSTWAAHAPDAIVVNLEDGVKRIDCVKTPLIKSWGELNEALLFIYHKTEHKTVVIDTMTALEKLLVQKTIDEDQKKRKHLSDWGFNTGFEVLAANFSLFLQKLFTIAPEKNLLFIGHQKIERYEDPMNDGYDRYTIDVHKKIAPILISNMDAVLFAQYETFARKQEGNSHGKGVGTGKRIVHTQEMPAYIAKNRFDLPGSIELNPDIFTKFI